MWCSHAALRDLALSDRSLAHDCFGVVLNCMGAWEDEYTDEHGEDALTFEDWMARIEYGGVTFVSVDAELSTRRPSRRSRTSTARPSVGI